MSVSILKFWAT